MSQKPAPTGATDTLCASVWVVDPALLKCWWPQIIGCAVAGGVLAGVYLLAASPAYRAEVRVVIQNLGLNADASGNKPTYDKEFLSTQAEVIRSPATLQRSLETLPMHPLDKPKDPPDPIADLAEALQVNLLAGTDIVRITFEHFDPDYAAKRLQSVIESYKQHARSVEQSSTSQSVELLTQRERELQEQLQSLQQRSLSLRTETAAVAAGSAMDDSPMLRELTNRWVTVEAELAAANAKLDGPSGAAALWVDFPAARELADLENQAVAARVDAAKHEQIYGSSHPERIAARNRADDLSREVESRRDQISSGLRAVRDSLGRQRDQLQALIARETERLQSANSARLQQEQLQREMAQLTEIHASTAKALEAIRLADRSLATGRTSMLIDVLDEFTPPREAIWPKPAPLLAAAVLLGLLLGVAMAVVVEARSRTADAAIAAEQRDADCEFIPSESDSDMPSIAAEAAALAAMRSPKVLAP